MKGQTEENWKQFHFTWILYSFKVKERHYLCSNIACVESVSVRFRRKERGTRVKDREKSGASKRAGSLFGSRFISRAVKTESPLPQYFFAPKPNGNACYAGLQQHRWKKKIILKFSGNWKFGKTIHNKNHNDANWMGIFIKKNFLIINFPGQEEAVCCFFFKVIYTETAARGDSEANSFGTKRINKKCSYRFITGYTSFLVSNTFSFLFSFQMFAAQKNYNSAIPNFSSPWKPTEPQGTQRPVQTTYPRIHIPQNSRTQTAL